MARVAFGSIAVWIALAMLTDAAGLLALHAALDAPWTLMCHRMPERVLSVGGVAMPLCSRCAGIWLGISLGATLAWPRLPLRVLRVVLPAAIGVLLVELVTQDLGLHPIWHSTRMLTGLAVGLPFGGAIGAVILDFRASDGAPVSARGS
jgi:uncharacterized membrane protein